MAIAYRMGLERLSDNELRRELSNALSDYIFIVAHFTPQELARYSDLELVDTLLGDIFAEIKRRREII